MSTQKNRKLFRGSGVASSTPLNIVGGTLQVLRSWGGGMGWGGKGGGGGRKVRDRVQLGGKKL